MKAKKVLTLPEVFEPNVLYLVPDADDPNKFYIYASTNDGSAVKAVLTFQEAEIMKKLAINAEGRLVYNGNVLAYLNEMPQDSVVHEW